MKQQFVKNRRSGEFGYRIDSNMEEIGDNFDCSVVRSYKDDTLDPTTTEDHIKHIKAERDGQLAKVSIAFDNHM